MAYQVISPIMNYFLSNNMAKNFAGIEGEKCTLIQLNPPLDAAYQQPIYFNSNTILDGDNATITAIELLGFDQLSAAPNGETPIDGATLFPYGVLTISDLKRQIIAQLPLTSLITANNNGKLKFTFFETQVWQNCYIEFNIANVTDPVNPILFNVYYVPKIKN